MLSLNIYTNTNGIFHYIIFNSIAFVNALSVYGLLFFTFVSFDVTLHKFGFAASPKSFCLVLIEIIRWVAHLSVFDASHTSVWDSISASVLINPRQWCMHPLSIFVSILGSNWISIQNKVWIPLTAEFCFHFSLQKLHKIFKFNEFLISFEQNI